MKKFLLFMVLLLMFGAISTAQITSFPFVEDFETNSTTRSSWTQVNESGSMAWNFSNSSIGNGPSSAYSGSYYARFEGNGYSNETTKLITPVLDLSSVEDPTLSFWYVQPLWGANQNILKIYYRTSETSSWVLINQYATNVTTWTEVQVSLTNVSSTYQIAFEGVSREGNPIGVDKVTIGTPPTCFEPKNLAVSNIAARSTTLSWSLPLFEPSIGYEIYWSTSSTTPTGTTEAMATVEVGVMTYAITDLTPTTRYYVWARSNCGTEDGKSIWSDPTDFTTTVSCPLPTSLVSTVLSESSARLSWVESGQIPENGYEFYLSSTTTAPSSSTTPTHTTTSGNTSYTFEDLTEGATYYVWMRANCGDTDGNSVWSSMFTFLIPSSPASIPYNCNFSNSEENSKWILSNGTQTNKWHIGSATGNEGLYISNDNGASNAYSTGSTSYVYAYRTINFAQAGNYSISFDWMAYGESSYDLLRAFLVPISQTSNLTGGNANGMTYSTNTVPTGWISLSGTSWFNLQSSWQSADYEEVTIANSGMYQLVFFWKNDASGGTQPPAAVDNIKIIYSPCLPVRNLALNTVTQTSAKITWTPRGDEDTWDVLFSTEAITDFSTVSEYATTSTSGEYQTGATDLIQNTTYYAYVRANCGEDIGYSEWLGPVVFNTLQEPASLPYSQNFENVVENRRWMLSNYEQTNKWYIGSIQGVNSGEGMKGMYVSDNNGMTNTYNNTQTSYVYAYRTIDIDAAGYYDVNFDWKSSGETNYDIVRAFLVPVTVPNSMIGGNVFGMSGSINTPPIGWIALSGTLSGQSAWQTANYELEITTSQIGNYNLVFFWKNNSSSGTNPSAAIDNISIVKKSCIIPRNVTATNIFGESATITWNTTGEGINYNIIVSGHAISNFDDEEITVENHPETSYDISELTPQTTYYVYIQSICGDAGFSGWSEVCTFRTTCATFPLPFAEGFNNSTMPDCWTQQYVSGTSNITFVTSGSNPTTSPSEGTHMVHWNSYSFSSGIQTRLVSPTLNVQEISSINIDFDWYYYNNRTSYVNEGVQVQYSTDGGTTWTDVGSFIMRPASVTEWSTKELVLSEIDAVDQIKIGFLFKSQYGDNCFMDNLKVYAALACVRPTDVTA
ncbi:fibronectin type III domain-containing protein, partial [Bacteroidales bacterium OttesenSCG-928-I21]|nr:fibronectin type III domain-containing protein [Bacteroidales bacterium OttesenSCG-928-I21]